MGEANPKGSIGVTRLPDSGRAGMRSPLFPCPTFNVGQVFTLAEVICFLYFNFRLLALGGQDHTQSQVETDEVNTLVLQVRQKALLYPTPRF